MTVKPATIVALPVYARADYSAMLTLLADRHHMPATFDEWQAVQRNAEEIVYTMNLRLFRALILPALFDAWCRANHCTANANSLLQYAALMANIEAEQD